MHLITQPVHVLPCSNSAMGPTEYCTTILLPKPSLNLPRVSLLEAGIRDCRFSWVFSKRKLFLMKGTAWRITHVTKSRVYLQLSDVQVLWSWHHYLRIWALFSGIRSLATAALRWMLDLWGSGCTVFVETGSSSWLFSSAILSPVLLFS
jgi:hypothetical protein